MRCFSCSKEYGDDFDVCPYCGAVKTDKPIEAIHLRPETVLSGRYVLGQAIGSGGFGIIYQAWDQKLETIVAVKEFFASRLMTRAAGEKEVIVNKKSQEEFTYRKERFLAEARNMAKFGTHRNIPNVFEFFEENGTAYIVMELLRGEGLNEYLHENDGKIDKDFAIQIANEVGNALISMHEQGIIHRDVAPDNIYLCSDKELRIKLLDLGAAKLADSTDDVIDIILKPGYSPVEQYDNTKGIGPWTDIYALGATLYVMLTGVKPDESTNRKIKDTVIPPHELDDTISENLSNAIMKAMAIERHMRFKTVSEFLRAINGERKVIPLAKEKKRRKFRRIVGIAAACLILSIGGTVVYNTYSARKAEQGLPDASISIWFSVQDDSGEENALKSIVQDFTEKFPNVNIDLRAIPESEYADKISDAAQRGELPNLFDSTDIADSVLEDTLDVKHVLTSEQADSCLFLNQYNAYYEHQKRVPLAIEVPMAYVITNGATAVDYTNTVFSDVADFGSSASVAADERVKDLLSSNFDISACLPKETFLDNSANTSAVLLSSSMAFNEVRSTLTNYEKNYVFYAADSVRCNFTYEWSIGNGTKNEVKAAERLLSWMLGNVYQNYLMISECSDGQIPLNEECFNEKTTQKNFTSLKDIKNKYVFGRDSSL